MKQIILSFISLFFISSVSHTQDLKQPLILSIKSEKKIYVSGESIYINYEIRNTGQEKVNIDQPFLAGIIERPVYIFIKAKNWKERIRIEAIVDYYPGYGNFKIISLGTGHEFIKKVNIVNFNYFGKEIGYGTSDGKFSMDNLLKGKYEISAEYEMTKDFAKFDCLQKNCWQGRVVSNVITIEIKDKIIN